MTKTAQTVGSTQKPSAGNGGKRFHGSGYLGVTRDGVKIVRPAKGATNFTPNELKAAVARALGKSA